MKLIKLISILFLNRANRVTGKDYYSFADNGAL